MMDTPLTANGLPDICCDTVTLYVAPPSASIGQHIRSSLERAGLTATKPYPDVLAATFAKSKLAELTADWLKELDAGELSRTRCQLTDAGVEMSPAQLMQSRSLGQLTAWIEGRWLHDLIQAQQLVTFFQPIVRTSNPSDVFAYECLTRGLEEDDRIVPAGRLFDAARATGSLAVLDESARLTAIESASACRPDTHIFININPRWIADPEKSLDTTIRAINDSGIPSEWIVFEVVESDEIVDVNGLIRILEFLRQQGYRVALDDVGNGYSSLTLMSRIKPDYIKLDMGLIRDVHRDSYKSCVAGKLLELARELDVKTVVEGVETAGEWEWAVQQKADYAQGFLFAPPAAVPPASEFSGFEVNQEIQVSASR